MKLTIKPDGTKEVEGTAEELAAYERLSWAVPPVVVGPSQQPAVLPWIKTYPNPYIGDPYPQPYTITYGDGTIKTS